MPHDALILCNGELPDAKTLAPFIDKVKSIIAADGGANRAVELGIEPHVVIGDLDSVTRATRERLPHAEWVHLQGQDRCDLEKALDHALDRGFLSLAIAGIDGRRIDFTLSNFAVLWRYAQRADLQLVGQGWTGHLLYQDAQFHAKPGSTVSLIPFGLCEGVTLDGLEYPLTEAQWNLGQTGVSNRVLQTPFSVRIRKGRLLMIQMHGDHP